jgi:hypothetical protein
MAASLATAKAPRSLNLAKDEPCIPVELQRFLKQAYNLKTVADYEIGPDAVVPLKQAGEAIETAGRLIETIAELLG